MKNTIKLFSLLSVFTVSISACGPKDNVSTNVSPSPYSSLLVMESPSVKPTVVPEISYTKLRENFIQKIKDSFSSINYKGYVKIIKDGNSSKFIYLNEAVLGNTIDVKLHYQTLFMDLDNKETVLSQVKPLNITDSEYIDLNNNKINSIFSGKCSDQYSQEILKDIDKYSSYDYFKLVKEGYNVKIIYGGKEYDRSNELISDKYYKTTYILNIDKCERVNLSVIEKVARPSTYYPVATPTPSIY